MLELAALPCPTLQQLVEPRPPSPPQAPAPTSPPQSIAPITTQAPVTPAPASTPAPSPSTLTPTPAATAPPVVPSPFDVTAVYVVTLADGSVDTAIVELNVRQAFAVLLGVDVSEVAVTAALSAPASTFGPASAAVTGVHIAPLRDVAPPRRPLGEGRGPLPPLGSARVALPRGLGDAAAESAARRPARRPLARASTTVSMQVQVGAPSTAAADSLSSMIQGADAATVEAKLSDAGLPVQSNSLQLQQPPVVAKNAAYHPATPSSPKSSPATYFGFHVPRVPAILAWCGVAVAGVAVAGIVAGAVVAVRRR